MTQKFQCGSLCHL